MKLLIFDCDGTLVDSQHMIIASMVRAFAAAGLAPPPDASVRGVIGLSLEGAIERLLGSADRHRAAALAEDYKAAFRDLRAAGELAEPLFPGVREAIEALARRDDVQLAIATGKSRRGVDAFLERERLAPHFVSIQTADEHPSKPHPSMILKAMSDTGAEEDVTFMIGDTTYDMEMAWNAGVGGIGVAWGYHAADDLLESGARLVIPASPDLHSVLLGLIEAREVTA